MDTEYTEFVELTIRIGDDDNGALLLSEMIEWVGPRASVKGNRTWRDDPVETSRNLMSGLEHIIPRHI